MGEGMLTTLIGARLHRGSAAPSREYSGYRVSLRSQRTLKALGRDAPSAL